MAQKDLARRELRLAIGRRIRWCRLERGLTQRELAEDVSPDILDPISQVTVTCWETGRAVPCINNLVRLSEVCDVNLHWLLTGEGPKRWPRKRGDT